MELSWLGSRPGTPPEIFLCCVLDKARLIGTQIWVYGGLALEAHVGYALREHHDVDFFAKLIEWQKLESALSQIEYRFDYTAPTALHVYRGDRCVADVLLTEDHPEGFPFVRAPLGANPLPLGSLSDGPVVRIWSREVRVVTLECLYIMKTSGNFTDQAGASLRPKDQHDLELIESRLTTQTIKRLGRYSCIVPLPDKNEQDERKAFPKLKRGIEKGTTTDEQTV